MKIDSIDLIFNLTIFCLFVIYILSFIMRATATDYPLYTKKIDIESLRTGDLFCISYNNIAGSIITSFTNSIWSHICVIWVDVETNIKYILEGAIYSNDAYKNFYKIPADTWLNINKNNLIGYRPYLGPDLDSKKMLETFENITDGVKLEGFNPYWLKFFVLRYYTKFTKVKKLTCFEAIVVLLQELDVVKKVYDYTSFFPNTIITSNDHFECADYYGFLYEAKVYKTDIVVLKQDMEEFKCFWKK